MKLFGIFLIVLFIAALSYYLYLMPTDPIVWFLVGAVLGLILALGIILVAEGRKVD